MSENNTGKKRKCTIKQLLKKIPKTMKHIIYIAILVLILFLGIKVGTEHTLQTKTTKFGLQDVGELVTQTAYLTIVQDNKEHRDFFNLFQIPFTESRQIFSYDVQVDASVDFTKISYESKEKTKEIIVKLPHAKVYKATVDHNSFKEFLDEESWFSRIDLTEHNEAMKKLEIQGIADAIENGLLEAANKNAQKIIEVLIKTNKAYEDYTIKYEYIGG